MSAQSKLCLVAGIGPGVGLSVAKAFAKEGYSIAMMARRENALAEYSEALREFGQKTIPLPTDLTDNHAIQNAYNTLKETHGVPDIVIYNAGRWIEQHPTIWKIEDFMSELSLCVGGAHQLVLLAYDDMKQRGQGTFLFTGGGLALFPQYGAQVSALTAGKSALRGYALSIAEVAKADNIYVGTITIAGQVAPDTAFDPDKIAARFVNHANQDKTNWQTETVFEGQ